MVGELSLWLESSRTDFDLLPDLIVRSLTGGAASINRALLKQDNPRRLSSKAHPLLAADEFGVK